MHRLYPVRYECPVGNPIYAEDDVRPIQQVYPVECRFVQTRTGRQLSKKKDHTRPRPMGLVKGKLDKLDRNGSLKGRCCDRQGWICLTFVTIGYRFKLNRIAAIEYAQGPECHGFTQACVIAISEIWKICRIGRILLEGRMLLAERTGLEPATRRTGIIRQLNYARSGRNSLSLVGADGSDRRHSLGRRSTN